MEVAKGIILDMITFSLFETGFIFIYMLIVENQKVSFKKSLLFFILTDLILGITWKIFPPILTQVLLVVSIGYLFSKIFETKTISTIILIFKASLSMLFIEMSMLFLLTNITNNITIDTNINLGKFIYYLLIYLVEYLYLLVIYLYKKKKFTFRKVEDDNG